MSLSAFRGGPEWWPLAVKRRLSSPFTTPPLHVFQSDNRHKGVHAILRMASRVSWPEQTLLHLARVVLTSYPDQSKRGAIVNTEVGNVQL
jgi:hypothetical protein